jgi:cytochrome c-type biogenesis protein CcmE
MKPKHSRLIKLMMVLALFTLAIFLIVDGLRQNIMFYKTSDQIVASDIGTNIKIGGFARDYHFDQSQQTHYFTIYNPDNDSNEVKISYQGVLPNLFQEGQGVVSEGILTSKQSMQADKVLVKHDETYKPPSLY